MINSLPSSNQLDINALARLFQDTTNSYKYLFFLALLCWVQNNPKKTKVAFKEIAVDMLAIGWYPLKYYHLSFGKQDQVGKTINKLVVTKTTYAVTNMLFQQQLKKHIIEQADQLNLSELTRYVPYRLLSPFFHSS